MIRRRREKKKGKIIKEQYIGSGNMTQWYGTCYGPGFDLQDHRAENEILPKTLLNLKSPNF